MKVFRQSAMVRWASLVMLAISVASMAYLVAGLFRAEAGAAAVAWGVGIGAIVVSLCALPAAIVWNSRVRIDERQVQIFNWAGRCIFSVPWNLVTRLDRQGAGWRLEAGDLGAPIPVVDKDTELCVEILRHLPPTAIGQAARPRGWPTPDILADIAVRGRRGADIKSLLLVFLVVAVAWAGIAGLREVETWRHSLVWKVALTLGIALLGQALWYPFARSFRRLIKGQVEATTRALRYNDGYGEVVIPWQEIQFVIGPGKMRAEGESLLVVAEGRAIRIEGGFREFHDLATLVIAQAPAEAAVFP